jgi:hypothetical protein
MNMTFVRTIFGAFIAAIILNTSWMFFVNHFGLFGGWIAAFALTGTLWFINHHLGLIYNGDGAAFIDMGLGIAISILTRDTLTNGLYTLKTSMPTLACLLIGAILAGISAGLIQRRENFKENNNI